MYCPQQNNNINMNLNIQSTMANQEKKSLNHLIYELRNLLLKNGMNVKEIGNNEIDPINIITFLLKKLHDELNIHRLKNGNLKVIYTKVKNPQNPKLEAYTSYKNFYTSNFNSIISQEYFGLIKTKYTCERCELKDILSYQYEFKVLCYIPFNVKILVEMNKNNINLNLYDAFDSLNHNSIHLDEKQYIQCERCKRATDHKELKQFYNLSKNLVIIFDRGENYIYKNKVNFYEDFDLNCKYVENFRNITVNYKLISVICRIEEKKDDKQRPQEKFIVFKRINNNVYIIQTLNGQNDNQVYDLNQIKSKGDVLVLFYYSEKGLNNFNDDMNNQNINNNINIMNSYANNNYNLKIEFQENQ